MCLRWLRASPSAAGAPGYEALLADWRARGVDRVVVFSGFWLPGQDETTINMFGYWVVLFGGLVLTALYEPDAGAQVTDLAAKLYALTS